VLKFHKICLSGITLLTQCLSVFVSHESELCLKSSTFCSLLSILSILSTALNIGFSAMKSYTELRLFVFRLICLQLRYTSTYLSAITVHLHLFACNYGTPPLICLQLRYTYTYPDTGYPDRQLSGSAWPLRVNLSRTLQN
jgi:hypothetical protein